MRKRPGDICLPMRTIHSSTPLPRDWRGLPGAKTALLIADITVRPRSRLRMKLLVFRANRDMRRFYDRALGRSDRLCRHTLGFVSGLDIIHEKVPAKGPVRMRREVDPRYFAVMCFVQSALCMEVVTHEAVHAAHAYAARYKGRWPNHENPEERICYPAGRIAKHVNAAVHEAGLYPAHPGRSVRTRN